MSFSTKKGRVTDKNDVFIIGENDLPLVQEVKLVINDIIDLLSKQQFEDLLMTYGEPSIIHAWKEEGVFEEATMLFGEQSAPQLLHHLNLAKFASPICDEEKQVVTFEHPLFTEKIVFKKQADYWYLFD